MLHQDHLTSSQPKGPLLRDRHTYAHWRCPYPPLPPPCSSTRRAPMDMAHHLLTSEALATLHLRICMDLWQIQHFPVLSLKNYQLCVIVQNANIPMIAFKKSQAINNSTKKKKKKVEKRNQTGAEVCTAGSPRTKQMNETVEMPLPCLLWAAASLGHL